MSTVGYACHDGNDPRSRATFPRYRVGRLDFQRKCAIQHSPSRLSDAVLLLSQVWGCHVTSSQPRSLPRPEDSHTKSGHPTMFTLACRALSLTTPRRGLTTAATRSAEPLTYYKITLRRSAIALPAPFKATLVSLGIHRRMQTVYHPHTPECAGKILKVKELVEVENVPASAVRTKTEQKRERKASRGYAVVRSALS